MPNPYSVDPRWRVVWLNLMQRASTSKISRLLCLSQHTVQRYLALFHRTGDVKPSVRKNGPAKLLGKVELVILLRLIIQNPGIYLREIQLKLQLALCVRAGAATICRTLKFMGKECIMLPSSSQSQQGLNSWRRYLFMIPLCMFLWIDESGFDTRIASENLDTAFGECVP